MAPLVQYSDSESDTGETDIIVVESERIHQKLPTTVRKGAALDDAVTTKSRSALPPLPSMFHDLYAANARVSLKDDPNLHGGRQRAVPHVEGNWPTHVYLEWYPTKTELKDLSALLFGFNSEIESGVHSLLHSDLGAQLPLHISLSRPVVLLAEQRQTFLNRFERAVGESDVRPFAVLSTTLDWVPNFDRTRWFLVLRIDRPAKDELNRLLMISNRSLALFGQPALYEDASLVLSNRSSGRDRDRDPSSSDALKPTKLPNGLGAVHVQDSNYSTCFHISLAWSLQEPSHEERNKIAFLDSPKLRRMPINFDVVKTRIGNTVSNIQLSSKARNEKGLEGL